MKVLPIFITSIFTCFLSAQTVYTIPQGFTTITIPGSIGSVNRTTAFSVTLLNQITHSSAATIQADFNADPDNDPNTEESAQTISVTGASWPAGAWTDDPYLVYLTDSSGAEEAFLIMSHTSNTLTVSSGYDLFGDADPTVGTTTPKFPSDTQIKIRRANTLGSIFGASGALLSGEDRVFVWNGSDWDTFRYVSFWRNLDNLSENANDAVVFPEEGIFVNRTQSSDVTFTLFGEVPIAPQISTVTGSGFVSSRYPVGTTIEQIGVQLSNWQSADRLYVWNPNGGSVGEGEWTTYRFISFWRNLDALSVNANDDIIEGSSAVFITRDVATSGAQGGVTSLLPYDPFDPNTF